MVFSDPVIYTSMQLPPAQCSSFPPPWPFTSHPPICVSASMCHFSSGSTDLIFYVLVLCSDVQHNPGPANFSEVVKCVCVCVHLPRTLERWFSVRHAIVVATVSAFVYALAATFPFVCPHCNKSSVFGVAHLTSEPSCISKKLRTLLAKSKSTLPSSFLYLSLFL